MCVERRLERIVARRRQVLEERVGIVPGLQRLARREAEPLSLSLVDCRPSYATRSPRGGRRDRRAAPAATSRRARRGSARRRSDRGIRAPAPPRCAECASSRTLGAALGTDRLRGVPGLAPRLAVGRLAQDLRDLVVVDVAPAEPAPVAREQRAELDLGLDDAIRERSGRAATPRWPDAPGARGARTARRRSRPGRPRRAAHSGLARRAPHRPASTPRRAAARARRWRRSPHPSPPGSCAWTRGSRACSKSSTAVCIVCIRRT